jgi:hypothetical protein
MLSQQLQGPNTGIQSMAASVAGPSSSTSSGTQPNASVQANTSSSLSYSNVVSGGTSTRAALLGSFGLYGNSDRSRDSFPPIKPLPKTADYDTFEAWRREAVNKMINTGGMKQVVTMSSDDSLAEAIAHDYGVHTEEQIKRAWKNLHEKACAVLRDAFFFCSW